jgi:hypothetical protein
MAIVQISKIQQRAGNLVDLPQLDNAEFGWAADENRLFIGRTGNTYSSENIEVLTSYSNISFSQIEGSYGGNFNITSPLNGQILTYVSSTDTWENYKGTTAQLGGTKLQLGNVGNISMTGGAIGYVLQTDGSGNLSWTPQGTLYTNIVSLSNATPIIMTVANTTPYVNGSEITITGVNGVANANVNGITFYLSLLANYASSGQVALYTDALRTIGANGTSLTYTNSPNAIATSSTGSGGSGNVGGANTTVQFNDSGVLQGVAGFTFDKTTNILTVSTGSVNTASINASTSVTTPVLVSNVTTGTQPLTVSSTTRVANLNVSYANVSDYGVVTNQTTGTYYPVFVSSNATGNYAHAANGAFSANIANGALIATTFVGALSGAATTAGTVTTAAQPNITSVGTLTSLGVSGTITAANITANTGVFTGNGNGLSSLVGANVTGTVPSATTAGTVTTAAQGNITSVGTLTSLSVTGTTTSGNFATAGNITASYLVSNVATGTAPLTVTSTTVVPNLYVSRSNVAEYSNVQTTGINATWYPVFVNANTSANYQLASNISLSYNSSNGALYATTFVGNVSGNISGNLTVSGSNTQVLFNDAGLANATSGFTFNKSTGVVSVTGNLASGNANLGNAATANFFIGAGNNLSNIQGANVSGAVASATSAVSATTAGTVTTAAQGNITSVSTSFTNLTFANAQTISGNNMTLTTGANTNVGTITGNWSLSTGSRLQATYADLAEYYEADNSYEPGTVLEFGGDKEVTIAEDSTTRVAGVVSTNPAYVMNSTCKGEHVVAIALQGRVPCKVRGTIRKGDMLVSGGNGFARPSQLPVMGMVIGKSLENFEGEGVIEVAVGRL